LRINCSDTQYATISCLEEGEQRMQISFNIRISAK
jgi:hypothetical protein